MSSNLKKLASAVAVAGALASAPAHAFLQNWYFDYDGGGANFTKTLISEFIDISGASVVNTSAPVAGGFSFTELGAVKVTGHDGNAAFDGPGGTNQVAAIFTVAGVGNLGGQVQYLGGAINVYANATSTFGGTAGTFGVDPAGSVLIATFSPITGGGAIDPTGVPNGVQTISAKATFMLAGFFFGTNGTTDLSTLVGGANSPVFGFATTNASYVANPSATVQSELGDGSVSGCLPGQITATCTDGKGEFAIGDNGQFRLVVPEPGSLALLGIALLGFGVAGRQKKA